LRYAISVNDDAPQIVNLSTEADSKEWGVNVLRGYVQGTTKHTVKNKEEANIKIYFLDGTLVLNTIEIK
jgi:hypothetical protein